jgi:hypothetical protein
MPEIGDHIPSALDRAYAGYHEWCEFIGLRAASFPEWLRLERGRGAHSLSGKGVTLQSAQQKRQYQQAHSAEIESRRTAALRDLGIVIR